MIAGRVRGIAGEPVAGARVRFVDAQNRLSKALGTATANADGEFHRLFSPNQNREILHGRPTVFVEVIDGRGHVRLRSEQSARVASGAAAYFDLKLTAGAPPPYDPRKRTTAPPQGGSGTRTSQPQQPKR